MSIASNLKREMDARAVSVASLAQASGVEAFFLRKYLAGRITPAECVLARLAGALGCEESDLTRRYASRTEGKLRPEDAAIRLGRRAQDIRVGLQRGVLPIGTAIPVGKTRNGIRYSYEIDPVRLEEYAAAQERIWARLAENT